MTRSIVALSVLVAGCSSSPAMPDASVDASGPGEADALDAGVIHPADASPQVIVTDETADGGLVVFAPPLSDASVPLFKVTTVTPNVSAQPTAVRVSPDGWTLWVADGANAAIDAFDLPLTPSSTPKQTVEAHDTPRDLRFDSKGNLYAAVALSGIEWWAPPIDSFKPSGVIQQDTGYNIGALAIDSNDTLYANSNNSSILVFTDPTQQPNPTVFSTPSWSFSGLEIANGEIFGLSGIGGLVSYALPLVPGEQNTFIYNATGGSRLSLSPTMDLVVPDNHRILLFAPPYTSITTIVPLSFNPSAVAFFVPQ
jgi:hypothetical protein